MDGLRLLMLLLFSINAGVLIKATILPRSYTGYANLPNRLQEISTTKEEKQREISQNDLHKSINFGQSIIDHLHRLETNLARSDISIKKGTPSHGLLIDSIPESEALTQGKDALIVAKASMHLINSYCIMHRINSQECTKLIFAQKINNIPLRDTCEKHSKRCSPSEIKSKYRSIDGSCNHESNGNVGRSFTSYGRLLFPSYLDGVQEIRRSVSRKPLPSPRLISNKLVKSECDDDEHLTLALVQWTEFIGNDLAHTATSKMIHLGNPIECCAKDGGKLTPRYVHPFCEPISIPLDDNFYANHGLECMSYVRSLPSLNPDCNFGPYEQINQATHFLDGSQIYGSNEAKMLSLRLMKGGLLKTRQKNGGEFLPLVNNPTEVCQQDSSDLSCFLSGDTRVNSHPHLAAMVTIWHREHNRLAKELSTLHPDWNDEILFNEARRIVIAEIQHITYYEYLPILLGREYKKLFTTNEKYDKHLDPSVSNSFATAAIRFTKSMIDDKLVLYKENREVNGTLQLRNHFNKPHILEEDGYLDALIRGLATQRSKAMDLRYVKDLTQHLYSNANYGLDVLSLDIQRGRDHGLPSYTAYRKLCGLSGVEHFNDLLGEMTPEVVRWLETLYENPDDIDLIVGGISEKRDGDSILGPTFSCIIADQMLRARNGDRFFYKNRKQPSPFTKEQLAEIEKVTLARIFCDNAIGINAMQSNVFKKLSSDNKLERCNNTKPIKRLNLKYWS